MPIKTLMWIILLLAPVSASVAADTSKVLHVDSIVPSSNPLYSISPRISVSLRESGLASFPLPPGTYKFGLGYQWLRSYQREEGPIGPYIDLGLETGDKDYSVQITNEKTVGEAVASLIAKEPIWSGPRTFYQVTGSFNNTPDKIDWMCVGITVQARRGVGTFIGSPVCTGTPPPLLRCNVSSGDVSIDHGPVKLGSKGQSVVKEANVVLQCSGSGIAAVSFSHPQVNMGGGITSSLSIRQGNHGVINTVEGANYINVRSELNIPARTPPGPYQGSSTMIIDYP